MHIVSFFAFGLNSALSPNALPLAYLDPGTGSYLLQMIIAGLVGGAFLVKIFWGKIVAFFKKLFGGRNTDDNNQE